MPRISPLIPTLCCVLFLSAGLSARQTVSGFPPQSKQQVGIRTPTAAPARPNIVIIVLDDVGVEKVGAYGEGPPGIDTPCTPNIDQLAAGGVLFRNVWTNPVCSPSRAQILTGRHAFRNGVGRGIPLNGSEFGLAIDTEDILHEVLTGYDNSAIGKWHLSHPLEVNGDGQGIQHPYNSGVNYFAGSMYQLNNPALPCGFGCTPPDCGSTGPLGYENWVKTSDPGGSGHLDQTCSSTYATTDTVDEAIGRAQSMSWPWFLYVAFNAPHTPIHDPPTSLCAPAATCTHQYCPSTPADSDAERINASLEALDTELGRLLAGINQVDPNAYILVIGDNGTENLAAQGMPGDCFDPLRSKPTLFEGGINVPLIASGPGVTPGECTALVNSTDLFATVTELARVPATAENSISIVPYLFGDMTPLRSTVYAELFAPNMISPDNPSTPAFAPDDHIRVIRDAKYKLMRQTGLITPEDEMLFDLSTDPCETIDLCPGPGPCDPGLLTTEASAHYTILKSTLVGMGVY